MNLYADVKINGDSDIQKQNTEKEKRTPPDDCF